LHIFLNGFDDAVSVDVFRFVEEVEHVETLVNEAILDNADLQVRFKPREEAVSEGAMALFGETYGETVRTVTIGGAQPISYELCGGTHVHATGMIGTFLIFGDFNMTLGSLGGAAYDVLRDEIFAVIPLFVLMGDFVAKSGAAQDLYRLVNRGLSRIPGRLAVATVVGNAIFAAVTGVSIASAAAFSRIAYPEMMRHQYSRPFALGSVAGSACLGMLIPPSVLLIIWGIITETSIGGLFLAGVIPGIILAVLFVIYTVVVAITNPTAAPKFVDEHSAPLSRAELISGFGILALMVLVLGGIWAGWFTPTEAAGIGALGAAVLGIVKGLGWKGSAQAIIDAGRTAAPIMFLLLTAAMYSRFLALAGVVDLIRDSLATVGLGHAGVYLVMIGIWLVLGMLLDSASIILLTVPIFAPVATGPGFGFDPFAFAIFGILIIEAGLLTPPVGLLVYTVKGAVPDEDVTLGEIFRGSVPYWILMLVTMLIVWAAPETASWLPKAVLSVSPG